MIAHGTSVKDVFAYDSHNEDITEGNGLLAVKGRAKRIEGVPLCAHCYVDVGGDAMEPLYAIQGALRRMDYIDGGLSRTRHTQAGCTEEKRSSPDQRQRLRPETVCPAPLSSKIYVSIRDPIDQPSFKPDPMKPMPCWKDPKAVNGAETDNTQQHTG